MGRGHGRRGGGRGGRHHGGGRHHRGGGGYPYYGYPYYSYPYYDDLYYRNTPETPQVIMVDKGREESGSSINWPTIAISMMLSAFMLMRR